MTRLQCLQTDSRYCVTLNPARPVAREKIIDRFLYTHPVYNFASLSTQKELAALNGRNRTYFCGSYFGYGFHEDAVRSAVDVGMLMGIDL